MDELGKFVTGIFVNDTSHCNSDEPTPSISNWVLTLQSLQHNSVPLGDAFDSFVNAVAEEKRIIILGDCNRDPNTCNLTIDRFNFNHSKLIFLSTAPFIRLFKRHITYLSLDLTEQYVVETKSQPQYDDSLVTLNITLNNLRLNFAVLLDNVYDNRNIKGRKFDDVASENLRGFDKLAVFWQSYKVARSSDQIPAIPVVVKLINSILF